MFIFRDKEVEKILAMLPIESGDSVLDVRYEIQDGGHFLLVMVDVDCAATRFDSQKFLGSSGELFRGAFPSRYGGYSWMLVLLESGRVMDAVSSEMMV